MFFNRELYGLDDEVHTSIDPHYKTVWEEPLRKARDGLLGDVGCDDTSECQWDDQGVQFGEVFRFLVQTEQVVVCEEFLVCNRDDVVVRSNKMRKS